MSYDVLVIGGGPAGLSAALNVRARGRSVLVVSNPLEENPLWRAEKVDNHLGMSQSSISQHLQRLRAAGVVTAERSGNEVYYRASSRHVAALMAALMGEEETAYVL